MNKKGQAAMEFLMTYGWAIMVVLVVIGAIAYFGFLKPDKIMQERCVLALPFQCEDYKVTSDSVLVTVLNGMGENIQVTNIDVTSEAFGDSTCTHDYSAAKIPILDGESEDVLADTDCAAVLTRRDMNKYNIEITYQRGSDGQLHVIKGEIVAAVP